MRGGEERGSEGPGTQQDLGQLAWIPSAPLPPPRGLFCGWALKLVGVVYLTELLTLPSSPSSPEGWLDLSVPGAIIVKVLPRIIIPKP